MNHNPQPANRGHFLKSISQERIDPQAVHGEMSARELVDSAFLSYNAGRLREACRLFSTRMLEEQTTVGLSLSGALTPAGLGMSCLVPLIEAGFISNKQEEKILGHKDYQESVAEAMYNAIKRFKAKYENQ